jgi:hypothetical protein
MVAGFLAGAGAIGVSTPASAQQPGRAAPDSAAMHMVGMADGAMDHAMNAMGGDTNMRLHMLMSPTRAATHEDTVRALAVAAAAREAIAKYQDTTAAVADGYRMFLPDVKNQHIYHFTNYAHAFEAGFTFDPAKPTSILYTRSADGAFHLVGAMYTAPKRWSTDRLDARIPLSIAHWHKHVNWCLPPRGDRAALAKRVNGQPEFGPASPIATKDACDAVGGTFYPTIFSWMVHVNVYAGDSLSQIFGDEH